MRLKAAILAVLSRDGLKQTVDRLGIGGVDRRSVEQMRKALARCRRFRADLLIDDLAKSDLVAACEALGLPARGNRGDLIARLRDHDQSHNGSQPGRMKHRMDQDASKPNGKAAVTSGSPPRKKRPKLTLARLETQLFEACDILRGNMDASEYKEYIFGMLFLKRLSDQFEQDRQRLRAEYQAKGLKADLIEKQLANPDKYDFFVPDEARWSYIDDEGPQPGHRPPEDVGRLRLNKALAAVEDANPNTLQDVLKGHQLQPQDRPADDGRQHPGRVHPALQRDPAAQRGLRVPRPARRRLRVPDQVLRRHRRQEGRRVLHALRGRPPAWSS